VPNVIFRDPCAVLKIVADPTDRAMTVTLEDTDQVIRADLIIAASGRAAPNLGLLHSTGYLPPEETSIGVDLHYTTTMFAIPGDAHHDWMGAGTWPNAPDTSHAGFLLSIEGNRWIVTFSG
jgi:pyruvate/2-oxoglutarate dehydrogenase complex dihydrolipoamide dehydrogenase (E3) component